MEVTRCSTVSLALTYLFCGINATTKMRAKEAMKRGYSLPKLKRIINEARKRAEIRIKRSTAASSLSPQMDIDTTTTNNGNDIDSTTSFSEISDDKWPFGPYPRLVFYMGVDSFQETDPRQGLRPLLLRLTIFSNDYNSTFVI